MSDATAPQTQYPGIPTVQLNDGRHIPQLGFGVFRVDPEETERVVTDALEVGYRHIDTAAAYYNEEGVGAAIAKSGIPRDELWVTTKLWNTDQASEDALAAIDTSLRKLGLDYVDLYLIHWPSPHRGTYVEAWQALIDIRAEGKAKSIGVSNFEPEHLDAIHDATGVLPAVDQIELHPDFQQRELQRYLGERDIRIESWAPLGGGNVDLAAIPGLQAIADAHGKSVQQVTIRWHLQMGFIVIPKSTHRDRMEQNLQVGDFELTDAEMAAIAQLDAGNRVGADPRTATF